VISNKTLINNLKNKEMVYKDKKKDNLMQDVSTEIFEKESNLVIKDKNLSSSILNNTKGSDKDTNNYKNKYSKNDLI